MTNPQRLERLMLVLFVIMSILTVGMAALWVIGGPRPSATTLMGLTVSTQTWGQFALARARRRRRRLDCRDAAVLLALAALTCGVAIATWILGGTPERVFSVVFVVATVVAVAGVLIARRDPVVAE